MKDPIPLTSTELVDYLLEDSNGETRQKIDQAKKTDATLQSLVDLLDSIKQRSGLSRELLDPTYVPLKIVEKRELLMRLYSCDLDPEDGRLLLNELNSPTSTLLDDLKLDMGSTPEAAVPINERIPILAWLFRKPRVLSKKVVLDTVMSTNREQAVGDVRLAKVSEKPRGTTLKIGFAIAAVAIIIIGFVAGQGPFRVWRASVHTMDGIQYLQRNWTVTSDDYRPDGFPHSIFSVTHSTGTAEAASAKIKFESALNWKENDSEAQKGLALHWYFVGNLSLSDSLSQILLSQDSLDYRAWNLRGLLEAKSENLTSALVSFQHALRINPDYLEAAYNHALVLQQLDRLEDAKNAWQAYLITDDSTDWATAARSHLSSLSQ
ncbi:tetratricopeptide repeat protein [bacterium]|nr:tetratricopeptide repeat protein [bacterium]